MNAPFDINGSTRFGGLIGRGLSHSLSPFIHNTSAKILGLDLVYLPFDCAELPGPAFFKLMLSANCYGFNVTLPYKEKVASLLTRGSPDNALTCNTLVARASHWDVTSTDADGFCAGLGEIGVTLQDFSAFIFMGYGGAAKALIAKIQRDRPAIPLSVMQRSSSSEKQVASGINFVPFEVDELSRLIQQHPEALVIQCTSAPLRGDDLSQFSPALKPLKGGFVDLVYGSPSALLGQAQSSGIPCQDGIPMLIHQALLSQKLWWGRAACFSDIKSAMARQS